MLVIPPAESLHTHGPILNLPAENHSVEPAPGRVIEYTQRIATAIVYCEANFGEMDGKTANDLIRRSEKYKILSVIDSENAGLDTGMVLDNKPNGIPICRDLTDALANAGTTPDFYIFGMAPSNGMLSRQERSLVLEAMSHGMNIVNGLHGFLNDDPIFAAACITDSGEGTTPTPVSQAGRMPEPRARSLQPGLSRSPRERKVTGRSNCLHCTLAHRSLIRELDILSPEGQLSRMIWG